MLDTFKKISLLFAVLPALASAAMEPRINYMINCQGCHLADGTGKAGSVPSMKGELHKFLAVPGGREFLVQVPGSANAPLNDAELAELLNWMLESLSTDKREGSTSKSFLPYTELEVKKLRSKVLVDVMKTREALVRQFAKTP
ncbi:c-type cytochrome [Pseudoteredinibacter isoporae]|uniref:c-type cytochrome n=1 Tax=Pseudoteredinibacter isoporae TaxID=570281 RepID=UPI003107FB7B